MCLFERATQPLEFALMKFQINLVNRRFLRPGEFALDQLGNIWQLEFIVKDNQVRFDFPAAHQTYACEQDSINIEQWLDSSRPFFVKETPLGFSKTEIVMTMMARNKRPCNPFQLLVLGGR